MKQAEMKRISMRDPSYADTVDEIHRSGKLCFQINHTEPLSEEGRRLTEELLGEPLLEGSTIFPPMQIDLGKNLRLGKRVIINHSITVMSRGGVEIEDDVMIGPGVSLLTANHEFDDHWVLLCGKITIQKNAWIGARAVILPGVTIGENAVVAAGAVVTKDVPANTVVGGNPARILKNLD